MSVVERTGTHAAPQRDPIQLTYGELVFKIASSGQVSVNEISAKFTPSEQKLFLYMMDRRGHLQSKASLKRVIDGNKEHPPLDKVIDTHIHHIRMRLAACHPAARQVISTHPRRGYMLALEDGAELQSVATKLESVHEGVPIVINGLDEVFIGGQRARITPDEARLLTTLISKSGIIHTRQMLLDARHEEGTHVDPKIIDVHACRMRKALGAFFPGNPPLRTVWGRGYYFGELRLDPSANPTVCFDPKKTITGPLGMKICAEDLPSEAQDTRWVIRRKAVIVLLVEKGGIPLPYVLAKYPGLSAAEYAEWRALYHSHGLSALRTTRTGDYALSAPI